MDCNFPSLIWRYSTFRNDLPSLVWQRYFTKASSAPVVIRCSSKCPMKSIRVSQHRVLNVLLVMWSSPAALVKVKLSASRLSTGPQSFFSQAAYHFRITSSFVKFLPSRCADACRSRQAHGTHQRASSCCEQIPARHCDPCHIDRSPFHDEV